MEQLLNTFSREIQVRGAKDKGKLAYDSFAGYVGSLWVYFLVGDIVRQFGNTKCHHCGEVG